MSEPQSHAGIWVLAEIAAGSVTRATRELLGEARRLAEVNGAGVTAVVWGGDADRHIGMLTAAGADRIIVIADPRYDQFRDEFQAETLAGLIEKYRPAILLAQASSIGRALIPRVASLRHVGLTADCTELAIDPADGALRQTRPAFGGSMLATIVSNRFFPQLATVRAGVMSELTPPRTVPAEVIHETPPPDRWAAVKTILETRQGPGSQHSFGHAGVIVAGGRGLQGPDGFLRLREFADRIGGVVGATRAAVDANWIGYPHQIGQTGRTVRPRIYLAFGISGQIQHLVGMQTSDFIVAVNTDPEAPIMKIADVAIVGDANAVIAEFLNQTTP